MPDYQLQAGMPPITLDAGYTLSFEAIDPETGDPVAGVVISEASVYIVASSLPEPLDEAALLFAYGAEP